MAARRPSYFGLELKRLRGDKELRAVARATGIGEAELRKLERGTLRPSIDHLFALARFHGLLAARLLEAVELSDAIADERLEPTTPERSLLASFRKTLASEPKRALAIATLGESRAVSPAKTCRWRVNRGLALRTLGYVEAALSVLLGCTNLGADTEADRANTFRAVADTLAELGHLAMAGLSARHAMSIIEAGELREQDIRRFGGVERMTQAVKASIARVLLDQAEVAFDAELEVDRDDVAEAYELVDGPSPLEDGSRPALIMSMLRATALKHLDDEEGAERLYREALGIAKESGDTYAEGHALAFLGVLFRQHGRAEEGAGYLLAAAQIARDAGRVDDEFYALFHAYRADRPDLLGMCDELYPTTRARTPAVIAYEREILGQTA